MCRIIETIVLKRVIYRFKLLILIALSMWCSINIEAVAQEKQAATPKTAVASASEKTPRLFLSRVKSTHNLDPYLEIFLDKDDSLTISDVISDAYAKKFATDQTTTGLSKSMWVRFTLVNDLQHDEQWLLGNINWDFATLYVPNKSGFEEKTTGLAVPFTQWDVKKSHHLGTLHSFTIEQGKTQTVYLNLKNRSVAPSRLDLTLFNPIYFSEWDRNMRYVQGIFLGILLVITLHNLFIFFGSKENIYLYYIAYLICTAFFWMISHTYAFELFWPNSPNWNIISRILFYALMVGAFVEFTRNFLKIEKQAKRWQQGALIAMGVMVFIVILRTLFGPIINAWSMMVPLSLAILVGIFILNIQNLQKKYRPARYYFMANIALVIGGIVFVLTELNVFPDFFITRNGIQIGTALQAILLSMGLADRLFLIRQKAIQKDIEEERIKLDQLQREASHWRRIDKVKDEFLANTSHELRTPLNGIIGIAESLVEGAAGEPSSKLRQNLEMIISSGNRLSNLVNDILDFSRLKTKKMKLNKKPVDICVLTETVLHLSEPLVAGKDLELINEIPPEISPMLADENRLQQVLHNLIGNAIKFTESGSVTISAMEIADAVDVSITDTGIGIAKDKLQDIFKSFEQVDSSDPREYGGTGLGLAITKQLLELHGGTIHVKSEPGKGSTFIFSIPVASPEATGMDSDTIAKAREVEETPLTDSNASLPQWDGKFRILIVDDEEINQQVLANHLAIDNYSIKQAMSGEEALKALRNGNKIDLVLLDIMMPKMSGYEVSSRIREKYLPSELPIIMLTAKNQVSDLIEGLANGANDYITKPFSRSELLARIRTHLYLKMINSAYARFVPIEFLRTLGRESIMEVKLGDQVQGEMTVMFSDIRSFTTLSENMTPKENFDFLNEYLKYATPPIRKNHGFIDKYIGDAIMSMYPRRPEDALKAAIDTVKQLDKYNEIRFERGEPAIRINVGLHTGSLMLGTIGDETRMDGTVISDAVNLASRLEGLTKKYGASILVSEDTLNGIKNPKKYRHRFLGKVQVKGKNKPVAIYEVYEGDPEDIIALKKKTKVDFEAGLTCYFNREFDQALVAFKKVLKVNPDDMTANRYLENSAQFVVQGVPEDWQGVEMMDSK